ncbi:hypothetical protein DBV08_18275 [Rhodococcus sp. KBW08]|nr:hypothetical protein DBV08_18275 [Rhodococcus sp. KBW08]
MASSPLLVSAAGVELIICGIGTVALAQRTGTLTQIALPVVAGPVALVMLFVGSLLACFGVLSCAWAQPLSAYFDSSSRQERRG